MIRPSAPGGAVRAASVTRRHWCLGQSKSVSNTRPRKGHNGDLRQIVHDRKVQGDVIHDQGLVLRSCRLGVFRSFSSSPVTLASFSPRNRRRAEWRRVQPASPDNLRVVLLGTGMGPRVNLEQFGASTLVEAGSVRLLFDCGRGATLRLAQVGVPDRLDQSPVPDPPAFRPCDPDSGPALDGLGRRWAHDSA